MTKVFALHYFDLKPEVNAEALEQFLMSNPFPTLPGWRSYYVKGERGERAGRYAILHEFDSAEVRDRYFPKEDGEPHPEFRRLLDSPQMRTLREQWSKLATSMMQAVYTDYAVIEREIN